MFIIPVVGVLSPIRGDFFVRRLMWIIVFFLFTLFIGLRHDVGGDWYAYLQHFLSVRVLSFGGAITYLNDPGYYLVNWFSAQIGGGIYMVNLVCGGLLMAGTIRFGSQQPIPWLALVIAVPYLIIVVGMGYTRQSAAIGLSLLGFAAVGNGQTNRALFWIVLGALFHKTAVILLLLVALAASKKKVWTWTWVTILTATIATQLILSSFETMWTNYVGGNLQSEGGMIRVAMNAVPALGFLIAKRYFQLPTEQLRLWSLISVLSLACVPLVSLASTAVDRMALYFLPLQIFFFSRLHIVFRTPHAQAGVVSLMILYYSVIQFVWLNYSANAEFWVPYQIGPRD